MMRTKPAKSPGVTPWTAGPTTPAAVTVPVTVPPPAGQVGVPAGPGLVAEPQSQTTMPPATPVWARATATRIAQALVIPFLPGRSGRKRRRARAREALPPSGIPPRFRDRRYYPSASPTRIVAAPPGCCQVPYGAGRLPATVAG